MLKVLFVSLLLLCGSIKANAQELILGSGVIGGGGGFVGPADVIAGGAANMAEGYSVTGALTRNYSGNLFQLSTGGSTLNVGQTASHIANLSGIVTLCGTGSSTTINGVPVTTYVNCKYSIIYSQASGGTNLQPSTVNASTGPGGASAPNCVAGGLTCAAVFSVETATGLPILQVPQGDNAEYILSGTDVQSANTDSTAGPYSVWMNAYSDIAGTGTFCCGTFGRSHLWSAADTAGTDYILGLWAGQKTGGAVCGSSPTLLAASRCFSTDCEGGNCGGADIGTSPVNQSVFGAYTGSGGTNLTSGNWNGLQMYSVTPSPSVAVPGYIHLGGGGDLSQYAGMNFREGMIINTALTQTDANALLANAKKRYPALTFGYPQAAAPTILNTSAAVFYGSGCGSGCSNTTPSTTTGDVYLAYIFDFGFTGTPTVSLGAASCPLIASETTPLNLIGVYGCQNIAGAQTVLTITSTDTSLVLGGVEFTGVPATNAIESPGVADTATTSASCVTGTNVSGNQDTLYMDVGWPGSNPTSSSVTGGGTWQTVPGSNALSVPFLGYILPGVVPGTRPTPTLTLAGGTGTACILLGIKPLGAP